MEYGRDLVMALLSHEYSVISDMKQASIVNMFELNPTDQMFFYVAQTIFNEFEIQVNKQSDTEIIIVNKSWELYITDHSLWFLGPSGGEECKNMDDFLDKVERRD